MHLSAYVKDRLKMGLFICCLTRVRPFISSPKLQTVCLSPEIVNCVTGTMAAYKRNNTLQSTADERPRPQQDSVEISLVRGPRSVISLVRGPRSVISLVRGPWSVISMVRGQQSVISLVRGPSSMIGGS